MQGSHDIAHRGPGFTPLFLFIPRLSQKPNFEHQITHKGVIWARRRQRNEALKSLSSTEDDSIKNVSLGHNYKGPLRDVSLLRVTYHLNIQDPSCGMSHVDSQLQMEIRNLVIMVIPTGRSVKISASMNFFGLSSYLLKVYWSGILRYIMQLCQSLVFHDLLKP